MIPLDTLTPLNERVAPTQMAPSRDAVLLAVAISTILLGVLVRLL